MTYQERLAEATAQLRAARAEFDERAERWIANQDDIAVFSGLSDMVVRALCVARFPDEWARFTRARDAYEDVRFELDVAAHASHSAAAEFAPARLVPRIVMVPED